MTTLTTSARRVVVPEDPAVTVVVSGRDAALPHAGSVGVPPQPVAGVHRGPALHPEGVLINRAALAAAAGLSAVEVVWAEQVHSAGVAAVGEADRGRGAAVPSEAVPGVDALVTHDVGVGLAVKAADCVPVVLVDPGRGIAAVHAGRVGVGAGVVGAALHALTCEPAAVVALVGPAIGGCCYEVEERLRDELAAHVPAAAATTTWGTPALDLPAAVAAQLAEEGVARSETVGGCTRCGSGWFSHRGSRPSDLGRQAGRQAALVVRHDGVASREHAPPSLDWPR